MMEDPIAYGCEDPTMTDEMSAQFEAMAEAEEVESDDQ